MLTNLNAIVYLGGPADGVVHIACQICANGSALHGSSSLAELSRANLLRAEMVLGCGPKCGANAGRGMRLEPAREAEEDALERAPTLALPFEYVAAVLSFPCATADVPSAFGLAERSCVADSVE